MGAVFSALLFVVCVWQGFLESADSGQSRFEFFQLNLHLPRSLLAD